MFSQKQLPDGSKLSSVRKVGTRVTYNFTPANSHTPTSSVRTRHGCPHEAIDALMAAGKLPEPTYEDWRAKVAAKVGKPIGFSVNDDPQYAKEMKK